MSSRAQRKKRKQRRHGAHSEPAQRPAAEPTQPSASQSTQPSASESTQRSEPDSTPPSAAAPTMADRYARSRARDEAARAALKPLEPGERPRAVTVAAVVTGLLGVINLGAYLAGMEVGGERPSLIGILLFTGLMLAAAWGAWNVRYWAVLGIQALLGVTIVIFSLLAIKFENVGELLLALAVIGLAGTLFWFLVKCMARIQMPERPGAR